MALPMDEMETSAFVDAASRVEMALRPKGDFPVAGLTREGNAFVHEATTDAEATRSWFDEQQPQLGDGSRFSNEEYRADDFPIAFRDPAAFMLRVEILNEFGDDARDESFELFVAAVLFGI